MGAKENHVFFLFKSKCKHVEIHIEYHKYFEDIEISNIFIYRPALSDRTVRERKSWALTLHSMRSGLTVQVGILMKSYGNRTEYAWPNILCISIRLKLISNIHATLYNSTRAHAAELRGGTFRRTLGGLANHNTLSQLTNLSLSRISEGGAS